MIRTAPIADSTDTTVVKLCNLEPDAEAVQVNDLVSLVYLNEPAILHVLDLVRRCLGCRLRFWLCVLAAHVLWVCFCTPWCGRRHCGPV